MRTLLTFSLLAILAGCKVAATAEDYRWSVKAPSQVSLVPKSKLHFTVEARTSDGHLVAEVPYMYAVEWVGVHGLRHQGWSSREEYIVVKGDPGMAFLRILVLDRYHNITEVARSTVEVTAETPPAK